MPEIKTWGASPDDWDHFDIILGLGADLLPVVSNPSAVVSKRSTIRALGKVPSLYNKEGKAVGILDWTSKETKPFEIDKWSKVRDYGICLQTRTVRALDIDVEDSTLAAEIESVIFSMLGFALPKRYRADSAKRLFAFQAPILEKINKRILKVEGGIIELLGDGQQAVVIGTHPKGCRYEWSGGLPDSFSVIDIEPLWAQLVERFGTGEGSESSGPRKAKGDGNNSEGMASDEVSESLEVLGIAKSIGREGQVYIECPWKHEHTDAGATDSATGTAYFPAGGRGYEMGHFVCKHAHCAGRGDSEFRVALGLEEEGGGFDVILPEQNTLNSVSIALPKDLKLKSTKKGYLPTLDNLQKVLGLEQFLGVHIAFDRFKSEVVIAPYTDSAHKQWRSFTDNDYTGLRIRLEKERFQPVGREVIRDAINYIAEERGIDTAIEWLNRLEWDGVSRIDTFLEKYFGADDGEYVKNVSLYIWSALAGRVLSPGCKADIVPVFVGGQGIGKSTGVAEMVPDPDFYTTVNLIERDDNLNRRMRGKLILEMAELRGLHLKDKEAIKDFISHTHDRWIPKFVEMAKTHPRRSLFIGTTNQIEFLDDATGNRRWAPVVVGNKVDVEAIKQDRCQIWAEARELFKKEGVMFKGVEKLMNDVHTKHEILEPLEDDVYNYLYNKDEWTNTIPANQPYIKTSDIFAVLKNDNVQKNRFNEMKIAAILRKYKWKRDVIKENGKSLRVWVKS